MPNNKWSNPKIKISPHFNSPIKMDVFIFDKLIKASAMHEEYTLNKFYLEIEEPKLDEKEIRIRKRSIRKLNLIYNK